MVIDSLRASNSIERQHKASKLKHVPVAARQSTEATKTRIEAKVFIGRGLYQERKCVEYRIDPNTWWMDPSNRSDKCVVTFIDIYVTVKGLSLKRKQRV